MLWNQPLKMARFSKNFLNRFGRQGDAPEPFHSCIALDEANTATLLLSNPEDSAGSLSDLIGAQISQTQAQVGADNPLKFPPHIESAADELKLNADRLIEMRFSLASEPEVKFDAEIDWQFDPTSDPARRWAMALHRHYWLVYLARAYQETSEEKYADAAGNFIVHWIEHNPPPPTKTESNVAWNLMGVGIRAMIWPDALTIFGKSKIFCANVAPRMLLSLHDHGSFLARFQTHLNHLLREANGLLHIALRYPEFRAAARWRKTAIETLEREFDFQIQNDGSHIELSPAYQWLVVEELESTLSLCQLSTELYDFEIKVITGLDRLYKYLGSIATPAGTWPKIKEGFYSPQESLREQLLNAAIRAGNPELQWIASNGTTGSKPQKTHQFFPDSCSAVLRSAWAPEAHYLIFQNGPFGGPHGHEDALSFELWAGGEEFLVDPGTSSYNINDPYRHYFTSSNAHNSVTVNEMSQVRRWSKERWWDRSATAELQSGRQGDDLIWVSGSYAGRYAVYSSLRGRYGRATQGTTHRREVIFVRNSYWLIVDDLRSKQSAVFERRFQCARDITVTMAKRGAQLLKENSNQTLYITLPDESAINSLCGQTDPIAGWVCDGSRNAREPAPQLLIKSSRARQAQLITLLMPAHADQPEPEIVLTQSELQGASVEISYYRENEHRRDRIRLGKEGRPPFLE